MNPTNMLSALTSMEPFAWLMVLCALYFGDERRGARGRLGDGSPAVKLMSYQAIAIFVSLKLLGSLTYQVLLERVIPLRLSDHSAHTIYAFVYWTLYLLSTITVFFIIEAVLANSLYPLPGLASTSRLVFRWASGLALFIALTAHIPIFGVPSFSRWLDEVDVSFTLCVCSFEISLLLLLILRLNRLGMCLRSRPVGLALGLTILGFMDLFSVMTINLNGRLQDISNTLGELGIFFALAMWAFYIVFPEPQRAPHSLSPASKLMRWNEIALQFGTVTRPAEAAPFISRVESTVAVILKKYGVGDYS